MVVTMSKCEHPASRKRYSYRECVVCGARYNFDEERWDAVPEDRKYTIRLNRDPYLRLRRICDALSYRWGNGPVVPGDLLGRLVMSLRTTRELLEEIGEEVHDEPYGYTVERR